MVEDIGVAKTEIVNQTFVLNDLIQMKDVLQKVFDAKLPIRTAYRLSQLLRRVNEEFENFEKMRFELFKRYGEESANEPSTPRRVKAGRPLAPQG